MSKENDRKKVQSKWYRNGEVVTNILVLVSACVAAHLYASNNEDKEYWENFAKGTFFITFFGGFFQRMLVGSNRGKLRRVVESIEELTGEIHQLGIDIKKHVLEGNKSSVDARQEILEAIKKSTKDDPEEINIGPVPETEIDTEINQKDVDEARAELDKAIDKDVLHLILQAGREYSGKVQRMARKIQSDPDPELNFDIMNLSVENILNLHSHFFPDGYEIAGRLRTVPVYIHSSGGTRLGPEGVVFTPPPPEEVPRLLSELVSSWNEMASRLKGRRAEKKEIVSLLSKFHAGFTSIHPFLDGNGRVARALLNYQIFAFFLNEDGKSVGIRPVIEGDKAEYYLALKHANENNLEPLEAIIDYVINDRN